MWAPPQVTYPSLLTCYGRCHSGRSAVHTTPHRHTAHAARSLDFTHSACTAPHTRVWWDISFYCCRQTHTAHTRAHTTLHPPHTATHFRARSRGVCRCAGRHRAGPAARWASHTRAGFYERGRTLHVAAALAHPRWRARTHYNTVRCHATLREKAKKKKKKKKRGRDWRAFCAATTRRLVWTDHAIPPYWFLTW